MNPLAALLLTALLSLAGAAWLRRRVWRRFFRYDARRDHAFHFAPADAAVAEVGHDGFLWPEGIAVGDTAFLELRIDATWLGGWTEPRIEMRTLHHEARQYFERGAGGTRYVNLSALLATPPRAGQRVWLHGFGLRWLPQSARLLVFHNAWTARPRSVVIAPHPDDAEIAAFGLYRRTDSTIVTLTAGDHGSFYLDPTVGQASSLSSQASSPGILAGWKPADRLEACPTARTTSLTARVRAWDSITAPMLGGVDIARAVNLGYLDSTLAAAFAEPDTAVTAAGISRTMSEIRRLNHSPLIDETDVAPTWRALVADLGRIFEKTKPELIATPHPMLDDHPDHAFATIAVCEALAQLGRREGHLLLYTNHTPWSNLHPVGANDGTVSLPPHFGGPLAFRAIKSLPLSDEDQRLKLLALEAHHDLRQLPTAQPSALAFLRSIAGGVRDQITGLDRHATSYFRRAVRPNELFFVVPFSDAAALRAEFLEAWRAGKVEWHRSK